MQIAAILKSKGLPHTVEAGRRSRVKAGVTVDEAYSLVGELNRIGATVKVSISQFNDDTVVLCAFAHRENAYIKVYAANSNQAGAVAEELALIIRPDTGRQMEFAI